MKKMYMIGLIGLLCVGISIAAVAGYRLLTAEVSINSIEGLEVYYESASDTWTSLPDGVISGDDLKPGETQNWNIRLVNTAENGILDAEIAVTDSEYVYKGFACSQSGVEYLLDQGTPHIKVEGNTSKEVILMVTGDGAMPLGEIKYNISIYRDNALAAYNVVCP